MRMRLTFRYLSTSTALFVLLILAALPGRADLKSTLDAMWMSTSTEPQVYESQSRRGYVGGAIALRAPVKNYQIVYFDPPRLTAGCGGIDMFFGSFSFLSAEEFKNLLRNIGTALAGYAFKLAIETMCPVCNAILTDLQNIANWLNNANMNSCRIAKGILDKANIFSEKYKAQESAETTETTKSVYSDIFAAIHETFKDPDKSVKDSNTDNPYTGNRVWRALWRNKSANIIGVGSDIGSDIDLAMAEIVMSATGTVVIPTDLEEGGFSESDCPVGSRCENGAATFDPLIDFTDLFNGAKPGNEDSGQKQWKCVGTTDSEMGCINLRESRFEWDGTRAYVHKVLYGTSDLTNYTPQSGSLVDRMQRHLSPTTEQQRFIAMSRLPILKHMLDVQDTPVAIGMIASLAEPVLAQEFAVTLATAILNAMSLAFSGDSEVIPPAHWDERLGQLRTERSHMVADLNNNTKVLVEVAQLVKTISEATPGAFYGEIHSTASP